MNTSLKTKYLALLLLAITSSPILKAQDNEVAAQVAQLRMIKRRMVEMFVNSGFTWVPKEGDSDRDAQVARLLAIKDGWWSVYKDVNHPDISFGAKAWRVPALLAQAWADPASRYCRSKDLLSSIERGLKYMQRFAYPGCPRPNNWWAWDVGMPIGMLKTLILTEGFLDSNIRQQAVDTIAYVLKLGPDLKLSGPAKLPLADTPGQSNMNVLWRERLCLQFALVVENPAMAAKWAGRTMSEIGLPGKGNLQADYSYKFHGPSPMWAYGDVFLGDYADLIQLYSGTFLSPTPQQLDRFAEMTLHYVNGFLYRGSICPTMIGRTITRGDDMCHSSYGPVAVQAMAALVRAKHPKSAEFSRIIAREREYFKDDPAIAAGQAWLTKGLPVSEPAPPVDDVFAYPDSDFLQITRPGWAMGIRMHSSRNRGYESINGENLQGWFLSHGSTFHFIEGNEWKGCWPTIDWTRLPGTTVAVGEKRQNASPFVGVMRISSQHAIAAMRVESGEFKASKSWLVDGQAIVCLGSGIGGAERVETSLFNQPVAAGAPLIVDGKVMETKAFAKDVTPEWIWLDGMGYVFPPGQSIHLLRENRSSDWTSVREAWRHGAGERSSFWYLTGVIRHTEKVQTYQYLILPHVKAEQMLTLARNALSRYRLDTAGTHRVAADDWQACVFWEPGHAGDLSADAGCILWHQGKKWMAVDPAWSGKPLHISIKDHAYTTGSNKGRPVSGTD